MSVAKVIELTSTSAKSFEEEDSERELPEPTRRSRMSKARGLRSKRSW